MKKIRLSNIVFEITRECNLNCLYCYNIWKKDADSKLIDNNNYPNKYEKVKKTLVKLLSQVEIDTITLSGGEPFLTERFLEIVLYLRMKRINVVIITNGNASDKNSYNILKELGVSLFELPFHSNKYYEHDRMTQIQGSGEKSLNSIKELINLGLDVVPVIILTKINYKNLKETLIFLYNLGLKRIMLNRFNIGGSGLQNKSNLWLNKNELIESYNVANNVSRDYKLNISSNVCTPICILDPLDFRFIDFGFCSTNPLEMPLTLHHNGDLRICNHSPIVIGNIFESNIADLLKSTIVLEWNRKIPKFCLNCEKYTKCLGGCRAASLQMYGKDNEVDPIVKEIV